MKNSSFFRTLAAIAVIALLSMILSAGAFAAPAAPKSNGSFIVEIWDGTGYTPLSNLSADEYQKELKVAVGGMTDPQLRIRKDAEGFAFLDSVLLDDHAAGDSKLQKTDFDMREVTSEGIVLQFTGRFEGDLSLTGRIEPAVNTSLPFLFPIDNTPIGDPQDFQDFFTYDLGSNVRTVQVDGQYEDMGKAFETRFLSPTTGHPTGDAYIYVSNDEEYLYACADFTSDNTYDYGQDFFKVFANVDGAVKEYKQASDGHGYGAASMQYTDKVAYEHMYYEMKIPLDELGASDHLQLAFSLYGTSGSRIWSNPPELTFTAGETVAAALWIRNWVADNLVIDGINFTSPGLTVQIQELPTASLAQWDFVDLPYTVTCATPGEYEILISGIQAGSDAYTEECVIPVHVAAAETYHPSITRLPDMHTMGTGDSITWEPRPAGGTWEYDETFFSATFNSPATFTALKAGTSTITYRAAKMSASVTVTVHDSGSPPPPLPQTGQDFTWVFVLLGSAAAACMGALVLRRHRKYGSQRG